MALATSQDTPSATRVVPEFQTVVARADPPWRKPLLICGIVAGALYVAMTLFVGLWWEGYSVLSRVPSELSAIGAPTTGTSRPNRSVSQVRTRATWSGTHRVVAAVDVHDLAGRGREEVGQQRADGLGGRDVVGLVPAER